MEQKLSTKFCQYLVQNGIITNEYYDVYVYRMKLLLSFLTSTILIIFIGLLTNLNILKEHYALVLHFIVVVYISFYNALFKTQLNSILLK